jgi:hypothetical protein
VPKVSDAHREERRRQILEGARHAFSANGYFGTNVTLLEQAIGLSRGEVDRDRIGELWLELGFDGVVRHIGEEDPDWIGVYLEVSRLLRTDPALRERWMTMSSDVQDRIAAFYAEAQQTGEIRSDVSFETVLRFLGVVIDGLVTQQGAGFPIDVEGTLTLVRSALSPQ